MDSLTFGKNIRYSIKNDTKFSDILTPEFLGVFSFKGAEVANSLMNGRPERGLKAKRSYVSTYYAGFLSWIITKGIEENKRFYFNNGKISISIYPAIKADKMINSIIKNNTYKDVDLIETDFQIYDFKFLYCNLKTGKKWFRSIRINYDEYKRMMALANGGKRYFKSAFKVSVADFINHRNEIRISRKEQKIMIRNFLYAIVLAIQKRKNLTLRNLRNGFSLRIYKQWKLQKMDLQKAS